ncbi:MAG: hypothetical protein M3Y36_06670, partial [Actinomycetota bacterium]|nr:hypothetical protein [Actinomycetota bacterium]
AVWSRPTNEALERLGLDFLAAYVWGRAAALGDASSPVVAATFAWFEPAMIAAIVDPARDAVSRTDLMAARDLATTASLEAVLADEDGAAVEGVADTLLAALGAAQPAGRPLFAGLRSLPVPSSPAGKLWRACDLLRELRGDSHITAVLAAGLGPIEANILTERWLGMDLTTYTGTRGWSAEAMTAAVEGLGDGGLLDGDRLTELGRAVRAAVEAATDIQVEPVIAALGGRLDSLCLALGRWSERCIEAGAFPGDELKRAAG